MGLPIDIRQTDSEYIIEASVPGFPPEDVEVTFEDGVLTIRGTRQEEKEDKDKKGRYVRRERRIASVFRQVGLPAEVRADEISAGFDNGVLRITVPRAQKAQPKRIQVKPTNGSKQEQRVLEHSRS
jgi:HSP20 family protein